MDKCPAEVILKMSHDSQHLKNNLKVPMVLLCWGSGLSGGCSLSLLKCCGTIAYGSEASGNPFLALGLGIAGVGSALIQTYLLNLGMKYFNNIDVMPIYHSMILMHMMLSGLILLDE